MLTMTHSTSQHHSPQDSPTQLPDQELLGITNGVDTISFDDECDDDDVTEPIAPCIPSSSPVVHTNGVKEETELRPPEEDGGQEAAGHVTSIEVNGGAHEHEEEIDVHESIIDEEGFSLEEFIVYVRNKTRNGLFDEYQEIKSNPPEGTFDHARMAENLVKVLYLFVFLTNTSPLKISLSMVLVTKDVCML